MNRWEASRAVSSLAERDRKPAELRFYATTVKIPLSGLRLERAEERQWPRYRLGTNNSFGKWRGRTVKFNR